MPTTRSAEIRSQLDHPVIDADGHFCEYIPTFLDYLRQAGGPKLAEHFERTAPTTGWYVMSPAERKEKRVYRPSWWSFPARNSLDRATAMFPALLRERLDEFGIDFAIVYSTMGIFLPRIADAEMRQAACRALNVMLKDMTAGTLDRLSPVAAIPTYTPAKALAELDYAVGTLGHKAVNLESLAIRTAPEVAKHAPQFSRYAPWYDALAFESEFDYDPLWRKCVELKVAVASHSDGVWGGRNANNFIFNHIGSFATAGEIFCKALVLGGVTQRFPQLNFGFLEGGVAWACELYNGLVARAEKRNRDAIQNYNPAHIDRKLMQEMFERYGAALTKASKAPRPFDPTLVPNAAAMGGFTEDPAGLDEFAASGITCAEDVPDRFVPHFYFGCEADDPMVGTAFNTRANAFGARLNAMFSSDIGHWDVLDMRETVEEAHELVEHGILNAQELRDYTFVNPAMFHAGVNPNFFAGTVVEDAVTKLLKEKPRKLQGKIAA